MDEILFITIAVLALSMVLVALRLGSHWLVGLCVVYLLLANLFASKLTLIFGLTSSLAIPFIGALCLASDVAAEHFDRRFPYRIVWIGFLAQFCMVAFGQLLVHGSSIGNQPVADALATIFSFVPRIVLGSFVAYVTAQHVDIALYHYLRRVTRGRHLWLRKNFTTILSQGLDSAIFLGIAFYGKLPNLFEFFLSVWFVKIAVTVFDTPLIYLSYRVLGKPLSDARRSEQTGTH